MIQLPSSRTISSVSETYLDEVTLLRWRLKRVGKCDCIERPCKGWQREREEEFVS